MSEYASDPGAGVFSLSQIRHLMRVEFGRAQRYGYPLSCLVIGIDRLEGLRDLYGYEFRETVLEAVIELLQEETRTCDYLGRLMDDRLMAILPQTTAEGAQAGARRILAAARRLSFQPQGTAINVTLSLGISHYEDDNTLFFDEAKLSLESRLGPEGGEGFKVAMEALNTSRPIVAARAVGIAQGAIDHAVAYIQERRAFGQAISDFQGVRWMLADMVMQTEAARQLVYRTAAMVDAGVTGRALAPMAAMAKCVASDVAMKVATDAVQLFGAAGVSSEYPINRYFRDAKVVQIIEGTNQIQRNIIANSLLGKAGR